MKQKTKEFILMIIMTIFIIAVAVSSCEGVGNLEGKKQYFPTRVGSGIR
tara:strand:+ start:26 stop:172 length:147 start_codon:yes stop_codon:yes gene_type:complete